LNRAISQDREFMSGQYAKVGKEGAGVYDESLSYFEEARRKWMKELKTPIQQELFSQAYDPRVNSHLDGAIRHQANQIKIYDEATQNAFISQTTNDAVLMRKDRAFVENSLAEVTQTTKNLYQHMGKEVMDAMVLEAQGKFHAAVIEATIEEDPVAAKKYFEKAVVQTQMSEKLKTVLKKKLDSAGLRQKEQARADNIMGASDDPKERLKMARESDQDLRDGVVMRIKARNAEETYFKEQAELTLLSEKTNAVLNAGNLEDGLDVADSVTSGRSRLELTRLAHSLYGRDDTKTDQAKMLEARILIDRGKIADIESLWRGYKPYADDGDWKQLESYFRSGGAAAGLKDSNVRTIYKSITGKDAADKPEQYGRVWEYVRNNLPEGRKPTDEEVRKLVGQALTWGERKGGGWGYGENMPLTEAILKGHLETWLPDVDDEEERAIKKILKENGKLVNDTTIRLYKKHIIMGLPLPVKPKEGP
jgi:hypothetical protein